MFKMNDTNNIDITDVNMILKLSKYVCEITQTLNENIKHVEHIKKIKANNIDNYYNNDDNMTELHHSLNHQLLQFKELDAYLKNNLIEKCNHNFIIDYIDHPSGECKQIIYCDKCELNKSDV